MSYEGKMLEEFGMPSRENVEDALLMSLFKHNGVIKEFSTNEEIVQEIANNFNLNDRQKTANLETLYRKENRVKRSSLWHRLLFRAADSLAKKELVSRPTKTIHLTNRREWMLTESGFDKALHFLNIPISQKEFLPTKSFEVQKIVKKLIDIPRPENYNPITTHKRIARVTKETALRTRGFRQAVIEAYNCKCSVCGMKICSPNLLFWEVEAAHIVPYSSNGRDDILNGLSLCRFHHWAFDVGWFTLTDDYKLLTSEKRDSLTTNLEQNGIYDQIKIMTNGNLKIFLPERIEIYPHLNAIRWHRENIFFH